MILSELLSELRRNILYDRSDRVDGDEDQLWDDTTLVRYIDEAQRKLAREGLVIRDATTTDVTQVTLATGQQVYPLHEAVIAVLSARYDTETPDLRRVGHWFLAGSQMPDRDYFDVNHASVLTPGKPIAFATDEGVGNNDNDSAGIMHLRVYPMPTSTENGKKIYLRVIRMPIERLRKTQLKMSPEVPEEHHLEMLDWAAYLALRVQDQDAGNRSAASDFETRFLATVKKAQRTQMRKLFNPQGWGFGRGGWSWER